MSYTDETLVTQESHVILFTRVECDVCVKWMADMTGGYTRYNSPPTFSFSFSFFIISHKCAPVSSVGVIVWETVRQKRER